MTFEHDLQTLLRSDADRLHPVGRGPAAARARAEQRRRRTLAAGLATVALVAVAAFPLLALRDDGGGGIDVATDPTLDAPVEGSEPVVVPLEFTWTEMDAPVTLNGRTPLTTADGVLYLLSTAPGVTWEEDTVSLPQAIYRSTDGVTWEAAVPDESVSQLTSLTERDGLLYATSTSPAIDPATGRETVNPTVLASSDEGTTWAATELPADTEPPDPTVPIDFTGSTMHLAATPDGALVALVSTTFYPDMSAYLDEFVDGKELSWETRDDGIAIVDWRNPGCRVGQDACFEQSTTVSTSIPQPLTVVTISWDQLGLGGRGDLERRQMFRSTDGQTWEEIDNPLPDLVGGFESTPRGIVAWTWPRGESGARIFRTDDGLNWMEITPPIATELTAVGVTGDRLVVVDGLRVHISADAGATWSSTDLGSLVGSEAFAGRAQVGPMGTAIVAHAGDPESGTPADAVVLFSPDGVNWSAIVPTVPPGVHPDEVLAVTENSIVLTGLITVEDGVRQHAFVGVPDR